MGSTACVQFVEIGLRGSIMVHPAVMVAKDSSGVASGKATFTLAGLADNALLTRIKETSADIVA